jgi:hypothetical protein
VGEILKRWLYFGNYICSLYLYSVVSGDSSSLIAIESIIIIHHSLYSSTFHQHHHYLNLLTTQISSCPTVIINFLCAEYTDLSKKCMYKFSTMTMYISRRYLHKVRHTSFYISVMCWQVGSYYAMFGQCFLLTAESGDSEQVYKGSIVLVGIKLFSIQKGTTSQVSSHLYIIALINYVYHTTLLLFNRKRPKSKLISLCSMYDSDVRKVY